jgi:hypothetical protein
MVSTKPARRIPTTETADMRQQAAALLKRLIADRDQSEQRHAELGKRDPLKSITGRSALDNAIVATRELIVRLDELLTQLNGHGPHIEVAARVPNRVPSRPHVKTSSQPAVAAIAP